jgi:hypothetical protein
MATTCPVSEAVFLSKAPVLVVTIREHGSSDVLLEVVCKPRHNSTGSFGYNANDKLRLQVAGEELVVQVGANATVVGSKDAPKDVPAAA